MPSLLRHIECPVCGHIHNFCLPHGEIVDGGVFDFRCPDHDSWGQLRAEKPGEPSRFYLTGAVALEGEHSGATARE